MTDAADAPTTLTPPAAVLFDMDGTLFDSEKVWDIALRELAQAYGGELTEAARAAMVGGSLHSSMVTLHADIGQPWRDITTSGAWLEQRVGELFLTELEWRPGAQALLMATKRAGVPTALVTNTGRTLVELALDVIGREWFDAVVCGDEVTAGKPHPEPYLMAARLLGVPIGACVAIEDSPVGIASAHTAGATVLAIPHEVAIDPPAGVHVRATLTGADVTLLASLSAPALPAPGL